MTDAPKTLSVPDTQQPEPTRLGSLLYVVRILLDYGRHLAETVVQRAARPSFATLGVRFGTTDLSLIRPRLERGILRAIALARVLDDYLAKGRDAACTAPDYYSIKPSSERQPARREPARRSGRVCRERWDDVSSPLTLEEIEAQVRRRPIGRTIVDICVDLAVMPALCERAFGNELFDAVLFYRGSIGRWLRERLRRERLFRLERDCKPINGWWEWWDDTDERIRKALGFRIGEPPMMPAPP